jgi:K+-transporting ATPase ATPase B chain
VTAKIHSLFDRKIIGPAVIDSFKKLNPLSMLKNPVIFVTEIGAALTTFGLLFRSGREPLGFVLQIALWLWFTVLFANFAEAMAEGRGKAQARALRKTRTQTTANRLRADGGVEKVQAEQLRKNDFILVSAGEIIPADGEITKGVATVDESAITGESAPVIREAGGDRSAVTGGTRVLSDRIEVRVTANPGQSFLDRMIGLVEGAKRQRTPNEIALTILLSALTIIFLAVIITLKPLGQYSGVSLTLTVLVALLVCLIPTTIGGLLNAVGIAGIDRLVQKNVLLLDKTGTITLGDRQAGEFLPAAGVSVEELADVAQLASLADETPEGRSIVVLAKKYGLRGRSLAETENARFIPFSAQTRMSGVDLGSRKIRKGAPDAIRAFIGNHIPGELQGAVSSIALAGGTPLLVADGTRVLGAIHLKDIVKGGLRDRFERFRIMGIKTVMITGDNRLTAEAIAREAGLDDFMAEATPEDKLTLIRKEQAAGHLVAMTGDGTNDAPALAQADVGVAMNSGTQPAKEAGNMVDLDSNPTKLIEVIEIGKQMLITRGALTTFSIANDVAKYFAIIPAMLVGVFPVIAPLNIMGLRSPLSAILSAVIFNALIIMILVPLALRGVRFRPLGAAALLRRNLLIYGLGGLIAPFPGIKLVDWIVNGLHLL